MKVDVKRYYRSYYSAFQYLNQPQNLHLNHPLPNHFLTPTTKYNPGKIYFALRMQKKSGE